MAVEECWEKMEEGSQMGEKREYVYAKNEMKAWVTFENMEVRFYYILTCTAQAGATSVYIEERVRKIGYKIMF